MAKSKYSSRERYLYLQQLVSEFHETTYKDVKKQVLANLGNFAYDPINYDHFRHLNIISLFLDQLDNTDQTDDDLVEFAIAGLCNLSLDRKNKEFILKNHGVNKITKCLFSSKEETVLSALTTLMFLITPESKSEITDLAVLNCVIRFKQSPNKRLSNLANIFLDDYCTKEQIQTAQLATVNNDNG